MTPGMPLLCSCKAAPKRVPHQWPGIHVKIYEGNVIVPNVPCAAPGHYAPIKPLKGHDSLLSA